MTARKAASDWPFPRPRVPANGFEAALQRYVTLYGKKKQRKRKGRGDG